MRLACQPGSRSSSQLASQAAGLPEGQLVILRKLDHNHHTMQLNVWCTTGTVGSYLHHPVQGKTQLFRRECWSMNDLRDVFANPRVHGHGGYHERQELERRQPNP